MFGLIVPFAARVLSSWIDSKARQGMVSTVAGAAVDIATVKAFAETVKQTAEIRRGDQQSWFTAWMLPTAFALCIFHFGAIVFDSLPMFGHVIGSWRIPPLPGRYLDVELAIIYSAAGVVGAHSVAGVIGRIFKR